MKDSDAAWLSGFIDGEAYVGLHPQRMKNRTYYQAMVTFKHTHEPSLQHVATLYAELGIVVPIVLEPRGGTHKDAFRMHLSGMQRILDLANVVEPWTVTKIHQWNIVRRWCSSRLASHAYGGYSPEELEIAAQGVIMNRRGPALIDA